MLCAYFDRSELWQPVDVVAVAGYVSSVNDWRAFDRAWRRVLDRHGVSVFHMTDFETRRGVYADWSQDKRKGFVRQLIGVLRQYAYFGMGAGVVMSDYRSLSTNEQQLIGHPYVISALKAIALTFNSWDEYAAIESRKMRSHVIPQQIAFVFEHGDEGAGELADRIARAKRKGDRLGKRIASVTFEREGNVTPLQAADFAAYETSKQMLRRIGADERPVRESLARLVQRVRHKSGFFESEALAVMVSRSRSADA